MKRVFDFLFSIIGLICLSPIFLIVAIAIKITTPGAVFFKQQRIGFRGRPFIILKFRSMKVTDSQLSVTLSNDNRITSLGRFLRKTKIDELPQLLNILKGEMSVVGPRPDVPEYALKLTGDDLLIFNMKPGLTGADSVYYPNEESLLEQQENPIEYYEKVIWPHKVRINKNYIKYWSFWLDIKIIIYTIIGKKLKDPKFN